jgi:hypothetical protein
MPEPSSPPSRPWKRPASLASKLAVAFVSLLVSIAVLEGLMRWVSPHPYYPFTNYADEKVGHVARPGFRGRATNMFGEFDTALNINSEGFRDTDHPLVKAPNTIRIAFLGDSFTFAEQVEEPQCFVRQAETLLNRKFSAKGNLPRVECMNFGIGGYDIQQYVLCYEAYVRKYHPDLVVVAFYVDNDLLGDAFYLLEDGFGRPYFRLVNGALEKVPANPQVLKENFGKKVRRLRVHWYQSIHLYNKQKLLFWSLRQNRRLKEDQQRKLSLNELWKEGGYRNYRYYAVGTNDPVVTEADEVSRLLLKRLEEDVEKDGGTLCGAMLPTFENLWPERWPERLKLLPGLQGILMDFERPFKQLRAFLPKLASRGDLLDTRPSLREANERAPIFFRRDSHYNRNGQEAVGQALADWLEPRCLAFDARIRERQAVTVSPRGSRK